MRKNWRLTRILEQYLSYTETQNTRIECLTRVHTYLGN